MSERRWRGGGSVALSTLLIGLTSGPARAECLGGGCYDGLVLFFVIGLLYLLAALAVLVLLILRRLRAAVILLATGLVLGIGVPVLASVWSGIQVWRSERLEIAGSPPNLATRTPLLIHAGYRCSDLCRIVVEGAGGRGIIALPAVAASEQDLVLLPPTGETTLPQGAEPHEAAASGGEDVLAGQGLELWRLSEETGEITRAPLTGAAQAGFLANVDYLVVTGPVWGGIEPGLDVSQRLAQSPVLAELPARARPRIVLAALPAAGALDFSALNPDLMELRDHSRVLGLPWFPENSRPADGPVPAEITDIFFASCCQSPAAHSRGACIRRDADALDRSF